EPAGRLHGLRAQRLLDRALHAHARVALHRRVLEGGLQVRLRVRLVEPPVVGVITVNLLWGGSHCRRCRNHHAHRAGEHPQYEHTSPHLSVPPPPDLPIRFPIRHRAFPSPALPQNCTSPGFPFLNPVRTNCNTTELWQGHLTSPKRVKPPKT